MSIVWNRKDAHPSENAKPKKTYILPISQLDAVMISLDTNDTDIGAALRTLESFRSNEHYPSNRVTSKFFHVALEGQIKVSEMSHLINLYKYFLKIHGSKVFEKTWERKGDTYPFIIYLKSVSKQRNDAWDSKNYLKVKKLDLLASFLLEILTFDFKDFENQSIFFGFFGIDPKSGADESRLIGAALNALLGIACLYLGKYDSATSAAWISKIWELSCLKIVTGEKLIELTFAHLKRKPLLEIKSIIFSLPESIQLPLIDHIFGTSLIYPTGLGKLVELNPSIEKLVDLHFQGKFLDRTTRIETIESLFYFSCLLLKYFDCAIKIKLVDTQSFDRSYISALRKGIESLEDRRKGLDSATINTEPLKVLTRNIFERWQKKLDIYFS